MSNCKVVSVVITTKNEEKNIVKESNEKVAIVSEALNKKNDSIRRILFKR